MTEQQFDRLKALLDASSQEQITPELDEKILNRAKLTTELKQRHVQNTNTRQRQGWPLGNPAIAFSALLCTVTILFVLAEMTSVTEPPYLSDNPADQSIPLIDVMRTKQQVPAPHFVEPAKRPEKKASSPIFDKEVLADIVLPSARQLVDGIQFDVSHDRQRAEQMISRALDDINQLINEGNLATAKRRYQQLREGCTPCSLPQSLEALARINTSQMDSG